MKVFRHTQAAISRHAWQHWEVLLKYKSSFFSWYSILSCEILKILYHTITEVSIIRARTWCHHTKPRTNIFLTMPLGASRIACMAFLAFGHKSIPKIRTRLYGALRSSQRHLDFLSKNVQAPKQKNDSNVLKRTNHGKSWKKLYLVEMLLIKSWKFSVCWKICWIIVEMRW